MNAKQYDHLLVTVERRGEVDAACMLTALLERLGVRALVTPVHAERVGRDAHGVARAAWVDGKAGEHGR